MDQTFYLGTYDPWLVDVLRRIVKPGDTCLDVGAHKGYVTLHLARRVGPGGRVFAFEPDPRARACLEAHCQRNRLAQVSLFPYALGREHGDLTFSLSTQLGWSSFFPNQDAQPTVADRVSVPVRSLDRMRRDRDLVLGPKRLTFVKIDTEGAERLVLEGMRELLGASRPMLWIEINRGSLEAAGTRDDEIVSLLHELGFALFVPHRYRRLGVPRVALEPVTSLGGRAESVFDVVAARERPPGLAVR